MFSLYECANSIGRIKIFPFNSRNLPKSVKNLVSCNLPFRDRIDPRCFIRFPVMKEKRRKESERDSRISKKVRKAKGGSFAEKRTIKSELANLRHFFHLIVQFTSTVLRGNNVPLAAVFLNYFMSLFRIYFCNGLFQGI